MKNIKVSFDNQKFQSKPSGDEVRYINSRIARAVKEVKQDKMKELAFSIGQDGCTFCPATFKNGKRNKDNFEQQQLIALDFDNKDPDNKISFEEIKERADYYELPIFFAYDTLSSSNHDKFRVVFLNDAPIPDSRAAEAVQMALGEIFPEADPSCYKDASKLYFGGKEVIYYDKKISKINIESVFRNFTCCMKEKYKPNHYKEHIARFAKETGIALNANGFLDVKVSDYPPATDNPTEEPGAEKYNKNGKNSPSTIICNYIIPNGEIFPNKYYIINFGTRNSSVKIADKKHKNHKPYRAAILQSMCEKCRLFNEFITGDKKLSHNELFGIATNMINVETGINYFIEMRLEHSDLYVDDKTEKWKDDLLYLVQNDYNPQSCERYCPYHKECSHGRNILATVHTGRGSMEPIIGNHEVFSSMEEMQDDVCNAIQRAFLANGKKFYAIKAQVGAGKSYSYLKLMNESNGTRFLIAVPTNLLKEELYKKAKGMGIDVKVTPSLDEIKDEIEENIWKHIQKLYKRGQYGLVHKYIQEELQKEDIPCLRKYLEKRNKIREWKGCVITTHRYLLNMDKNRLDEFDSVIIDEDIIFKSVISNQEQITVSQLKKLKEKVADYEVTSKIEELLKKSKKQSCIETEGFEWDMEDENMPKVPFDVRSFCQAEKFYFRRSDKEENLDEDVFTFLKDANFPGKKYIVVSATADEEVCNMFFGEENVDFYECKKAKNMGTLNQYPQKSMSRSSLAKNQGIIQRLMRKFGVDSRHVITFMKEQVGNLHFGNTEGSNILEGEDILVVGTPYHAEFIYKLVAWSIGLEFDEEEKMTLQQVTHNGYRFRFTTFDDEGLRAIHLWMIESELEQAVGRARLLRHNCTAHLFSNFPLCQAKMIGDFDYGKE